MIARLLSFFFPPKIPSRIEGWENRTYDGALFQEEGVAGPSKRKQYRDGIDRFFSENGTSPQS